jgi:hypothetical protein
MKDKPFYCCTMRALMILAILFPGVCLPKPTHSSLVYPGPDGKLVYKPYTDKGDILLDFSYCGYQGSEEPIPDVPVVLTVSPPTGKAEADGFMAYPEGPDSLPQIQKALDEVAAREPDANGFRGAVLLTKGTYYVNGGLIVKPGVVLRGEGDDANGTVLIFKNPQGAGITLGGTVTTANLDARSRIADAYVPAGSMHMTVEDAGLFQIGDCIKVKKTVNEAWVLELGMDDPRNAAQMGRSKKGKPWLPEAYQVEHVRRITRIEGNQIWIEAPLPQSIAQEHGGGELIKVDITGTDSLIGAEGLRVISNYDPSVKKTIRARGGEVEYEADEENTLQTGFLMTVVNGWVRNCTVMHIPRFGVQMDGSRYVTVRDCKSLQPVGTIRGGRRYSFSNSDSSMSLVYKCFAEDGRHDYVTGSRDTGPIAFVKSEALRANGPSETHHRWATGVLFDSLVLKEGGSIDARNRGYAGSGQGWAGANVVVWNCTAPAITVENPQTSEQNFAIGCKAPKVGGDGFIENTGDTIKPDSLFEQQLIDRIGKENAMRVLMANNRTGTATDSVK